MTDHHSWSGPAFSQLPIDGNAVDDRPRSEAATQLERRPRPAGGRSHLPEPGPSSETRQPARVNPDSDSDRRDSESSPPDFDSVAMTQEARSGGNKNEASYTGTGKAEESGVDQREAELKTAEKRRGEQRLGGEHLSGLWRD